MEERSFEDLSYFSNFEIEFALILFKNYEKLRTENGIQFFYSLLNEKLLRNEIY